MLAPLSRLLLVCCSTCTPPCCSCCCSTFCCSSVWEAAAATQPAADGRERGRRRWARTVTGESWSAATRGPAAQRLRGAMPRSVHTAGPHRRRRRRRQLCGSSGGAGGPPTLPVPLEDKASVSDITIAPFPRRAPPVKSFVAVPNKSLVQVSNREGGVRSRCDLLSSRVTSIVASTVVCARVAESVVCAHVAGSKYPRLRYVIQRTASIRAALRENLLTCCAGSEARSAAQS